MNLHESKTKGGLLCSYDVSSQARAPICIQPRVKTNKSCGQIEDTKLSCGQGVAFKTGPVLPRESSRRLQRAERNSGGVSLKKAVTFSGRAASSDASLIKLKLRSKYPPVLPAAGQLILHLSYWPSAVFVRLWEGESCSYFCIFVERKTLLSHSSSRFRRRRKLPRNWMPRKRLIHH